VKDTGKFGNFTFLIKVVDSELHDTQYHRHNQCCTIHFLYHNKRISAFIDGIRNQELNAILPVEHTEG
jgi:hypothetical protein